MKNWSDGKRFIFDHIVDCVLYGSIALGAIFLDPLLNFLRAVGLIVDASEPMGHPYEFGKYQIAALIFALFQLLRLAQKLSQWKYYS